MTLDHAFLLLVVLGILVPLYWGIPPRAYAARVLLASAASLLVLSLLSPWLPLAPLLYFALLAAADRALAGGMPPAILKRLSWLAFLPLPFKALLVPQAAVTGAGAATLGLAFCTLRGFVALRRAAERGRADLLPGLWSLCFFPTYLVGPVAGPERYARNAIGRAPDGRAMLVGISRIGLGCALFLVAHPALTAGLALSPPQQAGPAWLWVIVRFLGVYLDFWGFSESAIGAGLLFGVTIPENFRRPLLARSMQDFWQRWHRTLADLVATYLARPLARQTGKPGLAIIVSFFLVGLWHEWDANYLVWGLGHGLGLAASLRLRRSPLARRLPEPLRGGGGWVITLAWVATLSAIANLPDLHAAGRLVRTLAGL